MRKSSSFPRRETWISKLETLKLLISDIPQVSFEKAWSPAVDGENKSCFSTSFNSWWYISHYLRRGLLASICCCRQHCTVTSVSGSLTLVERTHWKKKNCPTKTLERPKRIFFKDDFCLVSFSGIYLSIHPSMHLSIYLSIYRSIDRSIYLSIHPSIYLSTCISKCQQPQKIYIYIYIVYIYTSISTSPKFQSKRGAPFGFQSNMKRTKEFDTNMRVRERVPTIIYIDLNFNNPQTKILPVSLSESASLIHGNASLSWSTGFLGRKTRDPTPGVHHDFLMVYPPGN